MNEIPLLFDDLEMGAKFLYYHHTTDGIKPINDYVRIKIRPFINYHDDVLCDFIFLDYSNYVIGGSSCEYSCYTIGLLK